MIRRLEVVLLCLRNDLLEYDTVQPICTFWPIPDKKIPPAAAIHAEQMALRRSGQSAQEAAAVALVPMRGYEQVDHFLTLQRKDGIRIDKMA